MRAVDADNRRNVSILFRFERQRINRCAFTYRAGKASVISSRADIEASLRDSLIGDLKEISRRVRGMTLYSVTQFPAEGLRVEGRVHFCIIVKVNEDLARRRLCFGGDELCVGRLLSLAPKFQPR